MAAVKECEEIQAWLSDYLEGNLDSSRHRAVEDHLYLCPICLAEHDALLDSINAVSSLPEAEPPPGFTERVMARVREEAARPSLWEKIFQPFKVKLPIHAAALVLIGVLAVYLYQRNQIPEGENRAPVAESLQKAARPDLRGLKEEATQSLPVTPAPGSLEQEKKAMPAGDLGAAQPKSLADEAPRELQAFSTQGRVEKSLRVGPAASPVQIVLRAQKPVQGEAPFEARLDQLLVRFQGKKLPPARAVEKNKQESAEEASTTYWVLLPVDAYEPFKAELTSLGEVVASPVTSGKSSAGGRETPSILVEITVLPFSPSP